MLTRQHIESLPGCEPGCEEDGTVCEMKLAMLHLLKRSVRYGQVTPALVPSKGTEKPRRFLSLVLSVDRSRTAAIPACIRRIDTVSGSGESSIGPATASELYSFLLASVLTRKSSGSLLVTSGLKLGILDIFLEQFGVMLCDDGYTLEPRLSGGSVSYLRISRRGGRESWSLVYLETMTGAALSTCLGYARDAGYLARSKAPTLAQRVYGAIDAYQCLLQETFGAALHPTAGMTALSCVRHCLPDSARPGDSSGQSFRKWRPDPLLVAMEREGRGYRGGLTYAERYRGPTARIDVVRQYTAALATQLPYRSVFARFIPGDNGIFLCSVRLADTVAYPLGIWGDGRFNLRTVSGGTHVCVLHTSEFAGLEAHGAVIVPWYGFRFTAGFSLAGYVQRLQSLLDLHGYESHLSKLIKPLGNYVYGKFGQDPHHKELLFSKEYPGKPYYPYFDDMLRYWPMVWEREVVSYTSTQHVEIAATITGAARSQTLLMWAMCATYGATVVRCHTDSLTLATASLPTAIRERLDTSLIGAWRDECSTGDSMVVAPNAYTDERGAHIAGVIDPTWEMVERVYNGESVEIVQDEKTPLRGFTRGAREVRKRFG